jgi:hypothetical protein
MKTYGKRSYSSSVLDLGIRWRRVVSSMLRTFYPEERAPGTHWIRGWVGSRAGLDTVEKRRYLALPGIEPRPSKS